MKKYFEQIKNFILELCGSLIDSCEELNSSNSQWTFMVSYKPKVVDKRVLNKKK